MILANAQRMTLAAAIAADPILSAIAPSADGAFDIATALNETATPDFTVWRTRVSVEEIMGNGFIWTAVDSLAAGKARIWDWMTRPGYIEAHKTNVRQGLADCFGAGSAMANAILPHLKRSATRAEKILATGTGSVASPATMGAEGTLSYQDVMSAMGW